MSDESADTEREAARCADDCRRSLALLMAQHGARGFVRVDP